MLKIAVGLALAALIAAAPSAQAQDKVKFNMSWLPQGSVGGILVAIDQGYYKDARIEVEAVRGYGGLRTVNEIDQGLFEFGYGNPIGVIQNRDKGGKTVMIGAINTRWPAGLCYVKEHRQPKTLADMKGMTVAAGQFSPVLIVAPAWLELNGLPRDHLKLVSMDPAVIDPSLIENKVDLAECWLASSWPTLRVLAKKANKTLDWVEYRNFKLDVYGSGLTTTEKLIKEKPDLVKRFVAATYKGYDFQMKDPNKAADILNKMYPILERQVAYEQITEINDLLVDPDAKAKPLGWQSPQRMESTLAFLAGATQAKVPMKAADLYTNQFVE